MKLFLNKLSISPRRRTYYVMVSYRHGYPQKLRIMPGTRWSLSGTTLYFYYSNGIFSSSVTESNQRPFEVNGMLNVDAMIRAYNISTWNDDETALK